MNPPNPNNLNDEKRWLNEKQGNFHEQEAAWLQEKQGGYSSQEAAWLQEKTGEEAAWLQEKSGYSGEEAAWLSEKEGIASQSKKKPNYLLFVVIGGLVAIVLALTLFLMISGNSSKSANPAVGLTTQPAPTGLTPTAPPPTATPLPKPTVVANSDADRFYQLGKQAYDAGDWNQAAQLFDKIDQDSSVFYLAKPLLAKSDFEIGNKYFYQDRTLKTAQQASDYYIKVYNLEPNFPTISLVLREIDLYIQGKILYESSKCDQALQPLASLYNSIKSESAAAKYRDTSELYYNCLVVIGNSEEKINNPQSLAHAKELYSQAVKIDVADTSLAQEGLKRIQT